MKVRIKKTGRKDPKYYMNVNIIDKKNGRLAELGTITTQDTLKRLFDASKPPSREPKHDWVAQAAQIKQLREEGYSWAEIATLINRDRRSVQSMYRRHYKDKHDGTQRSKRGG